jgi:hypothetical protein
MSHNALNSIAQERQRQKDIGMGKWDETNTTNDYIAYVNAYLGRAAEKVLRNEKEGQDTRANLVKAGALVVAAIEKLDAGGGI